MTKNHANYIDKLTKYAETGTPVSAFVLVYDTGKVFVRQMGSEETWQCFLDRLYVPKSANTHAQGNVKLSNGETLLFDGDCWHWRSAYNTNQAIKAKQVCQYESDSRPETKQRITLTKATDKALPLPYLELVSEGQENLEAWAAKSLTDSGQPKLRNRVQELIDEGDAKALASGQFGCMGTDPVAEANLLTLMRLIVAASGNQSEPPVSMADYWNATTLPAVRAAAQALLDFKAAVEF